VARAAGEGRARAALAVYSADRDAEWAAGPALDGVPEAARPDLRGEVGEALFLLSRAAAKDGAPGDALDLLRRADRCFPDGPPAALALHRAELADRLGRADEAADARRAAAAPARGAQDEYLTGVGHAVAGRWAEAVPPLERACRLDPRHPHAAFTLGYCLQSLGYEKDPWNTTVRASPSGPTSRGRT
jgi:tetratricopeptide (TPR) repeat protein